MPRNDEALIRLLDHMDEQPEARLVLDVDAGRYQAQYEYRRFTAESQPATTLQDAIEDVFLQVFPPQT